MTKYRLQVGDTVIVRRAGSKRNMRLQVISAHDDGLFIGQRPSLKHPGDFTSGPRAFWLEEVLGVFPKSSEK